jgi:hypothetical protein
MRDATALSQPVKATRFSIQLCGKAMALELFLHRQFVIKRENTDVSRDVPARSTNNVFRGACNFETARCRTKQLIAIQTAFEQCRSYLLNAFAMCCAQ